MRTSIICIVFALFNLSGSKAVESNDQTFEQQVKPTWPLFTNDSYIYLLGLFVKQRISIYRHFNTVAEPAMLRAAIILSQRLNITADGKEFAYRMESTSGQDVIDTLDCACQAIEENQILGIVGPEYSSEAKTLSSFANRVGLPVIGYSTSDPELSNRNEYHTFYRLPPSDLTTAYALSKLFQQYNWNSTNVIYQSDNYGESGLRALTEAFNEKINISRRIKYDLLTHEIDSLQRQLERSPSRIVIVWANANITTQIIQRAIKAGNILAPSFLWILMAPNTTMHISDNQNVDQLSGMFLLRLVTPNVFGIPVNTELLHNATAIWQEYEPETYPDDEKKIDIYALYAFDAAWTLILAIEKLCQQNPTTCLSYENRSSCFKSQLVHHYELNQIIQTMNFTGVSGHIQFQSNTTDRVGSITAQYIIDNLQPSKNDSNKLEIVEVLRLNGTIIDMKRHNEHQWEPSDSTIRWPSNSSEAPKSYSRLAGATLNITVYISPPFFMMIPDANNTLHPDGYIHDLIQLLKERMKFEYNYTVASSNWSFDELVKSVENNKCEILAADLAITPSRAKKIDFSFPIYDNTLRLVVRRGKGTEFSLFAFLKPFSWQLWILIFFIIYICSVLLIILHEWLEQEENRRCEMALNKTPKAQYDTGLMLLRKGLTFQPTSFFGSCQTIIVSPISIIFIALLTSNLIIYFKAQYEKPWLQSIEDLRMCQKVACNRIGVIGGSQHEEYMREEVMNGSTMDFHRLKHTDECYAKLLDHRIDVAIADSSSADYFTQMPGYCQLETTGVPFGKTYFGIAMSKQWPYKQDLDNEIVYLKSNGELERLLARWFQKKNCDQENDHFNKGLTISETSGLFIIFAGLTGVNLIVFLGKYRYYRNKKLSERM